MYSSLSPRDMTREDLIRMCAQERQRGLDGHWTYDLARHRSYLDELRRRERETHSYGWLQMQRLAQGGRR